MDYEGHPCNANSISDMKACSKSHFPEFKQPRGMCSLHKMLRRWVTQWISGKSHRAEKIGF